MVMRKLGVKEWLVSAVMSMYTGAKTHGAGEVVEAFSDRKVDMVCIQEARSKGSGCKFYGTKGKRYKLFWVGVEERLDGVEKWVDSVVRVEWHSKRVLILKMVLMVY